MKEIGQKHFSLGTVLLAFLLVPVATGASTGDIEVYGINVSSSEAGTDVILKASGPFTFEERGGGEAASYLSYAPDPSSLVLELHGAGVRALAERNLEPDTDEIEAIRILSEEENGGYCPRIEFIKKSPSVSQRIRIERKSLVITFRSDREPAAGPALPASSPAKAVRGPSLSAKPISSGVFTGLAVSKEEGRLVVTLGIDGRVPYETLDLSHPSRFVIDLEGVRNGYRKSRMDIGLASVTRARVSQFKLKPKPVTRIVFDLERPVPHSVNESGRNLKISFEDPALRAEEQPAVTRAARRHREELSTEDYFINIDSHEFTNPGIIQEINVENTPVRGGSQADVLFETADASEAGMFPERSDKEELPYTTIFETQTVTAAEKVYIGTPISLDVKNADILDIFRFFHELTGINIVVDPAIKGKQITIAVELVPWDQVLDLILMAHNLGSTLENNVLRIASLQKLTQEQSAARTFEEAKQLSGPLEMVARPLSYAKASEISPKIKQVASGRGRVDFDERTNTLIIQDIKKKIPELNRLIEILDRPNPQVMIEARIVETTKTFTKSFGIQWGLNYIADRAFGNTTNFSFPNNFQIIGNNIESDIGFNVERFPLGGYAVNLPVSGFNSAVGISMGNILNTFQLDLALMGLEAQGKARIISNPKIVAENNEEASIESGVQIPVVNTTATEIDVRFISASLKLAVTPQITPEGSVVLEVTIENNSPDFLNTVADMPSIVTRTAKTSVLVKDGCTTVIGGIYQVNEGTATSKVPFFSRIPILGWLFRNRTKDRTNDELLIFITPRIQKTI